MTTNLAKGTVRSYRNPLSEMEAINLLELRSFKADSSAFFQIISIIEYFEK